MSLHENLVIVGFVTTCMGPGHILAAPLQAAQHVAYAASSQKQKNPG